MVKKKQKTNYLINKYFVFSDIKNQSDEEWKVRLKKEFLISNY